MDPITNRTDPTVSARQDSPAPARAPDASAASEDATNASLNQITDLSSIAQKASAGPDLRADEVERGKRLVADPNYPSDDLLEKLAEGLLGTDDFTNAL